MVECDRCNLEIVFQGMGGQIKCPCCNAVTRNIENEVCLETNGVECALLKQTELLSPMEQRILKLYYGLEDGGRRTMQEIAVFLNCDVAQVEAIHKEALRAMRVLLSNK